MLRTLLLGLSLLLAGSISSAAAVIGDDGLHKEDWFAITFRDVAEDIEAALRRLGEQHQVFMVEGHRERHVSHEDSPPSQPPSGCCAILPTSAATPHR